MTGRWGVGVVVSVAVVASACSGGDGDAPAAPLEPTESIVVESSVVATTTTSPSPSTTSTTSTTEPPPPTTTLEDLRLDIEADLNEGERVFLEGAATPGDPDAIAALADHHIGEALATAEALYQSLESSGFIGRVNLEVPSTIEVLEVLMAESPEAVVVYCRVDAGIVVDENEDVVDDSIVQYTVEAEMRLDNGVWKLSGGRELSRIEGATECGP
jgi:hypothetical protein